MADQRSRRHSAVGIVTRLLAGRSGAQIPAWTREFSLLLEPYLHYRYTPLVRFKIMIHIPYRKERSIFFQIKNGNT